MKSGKNQRREEKRKKLREEKESFFTNNLWHAIFHTTLSHTIFHTPLCLNSHTTLSHTIFHHTIFHTPSFTTPSFTHHFSHTIFHHTIFHTPLCHTPSLTHHLSPTIFDTPFFARNFVTCSLSHRTFTHTILDTLLYTTLHYTTLHYTKLHYTNYTAPQLHYTNYITLQLQLWNYSFLSLKLPPPPCAVLLVLYLIIYETLVCEFIPTGFATSNGSRFATMHFWESGGSLRKCQNMLHRACCRNIFPQWCNYIINILNIIRYFLSISVREFERHGQGRGDVGMVIYTTDIW